jgi:hypothetical protein
MHHSANPNYTPFGTRCRAARSPKNPAIFGSTALPDNRPPNGRFLTCANGC